MGSQYAVRPALHISGDALRQIVSPTTTPGDGGDDNGDDGDDGDDNGGEVPVTPTPSNPIVPDYVDKSQKSLTPGAIGGIIAGSLVAVGGATCLTIYFISKRRKLLHKTI